MSIHPLVPQCFCVSVKYGNMVICIVHVHIYPEFPHWGECVYLSST